MVCWHGEIHLRFILIHYKTQQQILRIINFKPKLFRSEKLFTEYGVLSIRQHYIQKCIIYTNTHLQLQNTIDHKHDTRIRNTHFLVPRMKKSIGQRQVSYQGPKLYNLLPLEIKIEKSNFKKWLKIG